jgi:predicted phosphate transport protein (TIGR00153 family)
MDGAALLRRRWRDSTAGDDTTMLSWFQAMMPKEGRFFGMFDRHAQTLVQGAEALRKLLDGGDEVPNWCERVSHFENEADGITREVLTAVSRTFITPFDRGDIKDLTTTLDDAIDQMQKTAKAVTLFEQREFAPEMRQMADIIVRTAALTVELVGSLKDLRHNSKRVSELAQEVTRLEEEADSIYDTGMKALFLKSRSGNAMDYVVGAEIYDHLEKVVDRFEDVANRVSTILIEHM